ARTEAERVAPPATTTSAFASGSSATSAGTTSTTPSECAAAASSAQSSTRRPPRRRYCLRAPNRVPLPPATTIVQVPRPTGATVARARPLLRVGDGGHHGVEALGCAM